MFVFNTFGYHRSKFQIDTLSKELGESHYAVVKGLQLVVPDLFLKIGNSLGSNFDLNPVWNEIQNHKIPVHSELFLNINPMDGSSSESQILLNEILENPKLYYTLINEYAGFSNWDAALKLVYNIYPSIFATLNQLVKTENYNQNDLAGILLSQKSDLIKMLPVGWQDLTSKPLQTKNVEYKKYQMEQIQNSEQKKWGYWLVGLLVLLAGLWMVLKGCNKQEIMDRTNNAIQSAVAVVDSVKIKAEAATKSATELLDSTANEFKKRWNTLGNIIEIKLDKYDLKLPEHGVEMKLINWLQNKSSIVDKTSWFNFDRILFEPGSATLNAVSNEQISNIAIIMKAMPNVEIKIGGYTDNTGDPKANRSLSLDRANAVAAALIAKEIQPGRLTTEGYGSEHPVADNNTTEGKEQNRRVAIRVTKK